jgi:hypothetical protein
VAVLLPTNYDEFQLSLFHKKYQFFHQQMQQQQKEK